MWQLSSPEGICLELLFSHSGGENRIFKENYSSSPKISAEKM
jgi:hypothetical protein